MKIICKKENDARKVLKFVNNLLEKECIDYPVLKDNFVLDITLKSLDNTDCPKNSETVCIEEGDLANTDIDTNTLEFYYNNDALTKLYNRGKYERDIIKFQSNYTDNFACIYIDAVGLHEVNNHLGHSAGDEMLCQIADGIRQIFINCPAYRIGGDEFVIFSFNQNESDINQAIYKLRKILSANDYEISVGFKFINNSMSFSQTINQAELAMRSDKADFYQKNGASRQMRNLNYKLEKILLEKQDAAHFLSAIAFEYKGVYVVNPTSDMCRYIYIPEYFQKILETNNGVFSKSINSYCDMLVCEQDQEHFYKICDFEYILKTVKQGKQIEYTYTKKDGCKVRLQITLYTPDSLDTNEMLWIFTDER